MEIIEVINKSFLLTNSQKKYLINKLKTANNEYVLELFNILNQEKVFVISLLKKYKDDNKNYSIAKLKWEMISKHLHKIQQLEIDDNDSIFDLDKELENI